MQTATGLFKTADTVGSIVAQRPALSRVFEQAGIDYCCGGKISLEQACRKKRIDPQTFLAQLEEAAAGDASVDAAAMSLTALADHIEATHHTYLKSELPRLDAMTQKVATVHGGEDARLHQVRETFLALAAEMTSHMMKEEQILFPMVRQLEASSTPPAFHCGSLANPIHQMEMEHDQAGAALAKLRDLSDGFNPPDWACNTYRAMLDALAHLERDLHQHVHKENNILFPHAIALESQRLAT
jgi:regulator of cell morphogenesis and NO signaling